MISPPTIAAFRFGFGLHPDLEGPADAEALLAALETPRAVHDDWPARRELHDELRAARKDRNTGAEGAADRNKAINRALMRTRRDDQRTEFRDALLSPMGIDQRLIRFWSDHFTVAQANAVLALHRPHLRATAIAPHITGRFKDMLRAVTLHPAMLVYLDQVRSFGPDSPAGQRRGLGLNENLAREILELHTLGVDAAYGQRDVREFAELLTGLSNGRDGFVFRSARAEPGAETVLGIRYGDGTPDMDPVLQALDDLAEHPATAAHLARKLVVHFIGAPAPEALVQDMAAAYAAEDTSLMAMYRVLLASPEAWAPEFTKTRTPFEFVTAAMRAAGYKGEDLDALSRGAVDARLVRPMAEMGQTLWRPDGPDGWPEAPEAWITPVGLAARLRWSASFAERALPDADPRAFLDDALGDAASGTLRFAVSGAEQRREGIVLVLASPEFNRR